MVQICKSDLSLGLPVFLRACSVWSPPRALLFLDAVWKTWTLFALFFFFVMLPVMLPAFPFCFLLSLFSALMQQCFLSHEAKLLSFCASFFFFFLYWPVLWLYSFIAHPLTVSLLSTSLLSLGLPAPRVSPFSPRFPAAVLPVDTTLSPPSHVFSNAALLACYVWLTGSRVRVKCQSNFFLSSSLKGVPWNGMWTPKNSLLLGKV